MEIVEHPWEALGPALAERVAGDLRDALTNGRAGLALPGGSTPGPFLEALGQVALEWERVGVTLTDERWVPVGDTRSNQRLLAERFFGGPASAAEFVPLYTGQETPADAVGAVSGALANIVLPLTVAVCGMGDDMHTASLFPGAVGLTAALAADAEAVAPIRAAAAEEPRITLTRPVLEGASQRYLLIRGAGKRATLQAALERDVAEAPVRLLFDAPGGCTVFYAE